MKKTPEQLAKKIMDHFILPHFKLQHEEIMHIMDAQSWLDMTERSIADVIRHDLDIKSIVNE